MFNRYNRWFWNSAPLDWAAWALSRITAWLRRRQFRRNCLTNFWHSVDGRDGDDQDETGEICIGRGGACGEQNVLTLRPNENVKVESHPVNKMRRELMIGVPAAFVAVKAGKLNAYGTDGQAPKRVMKDHTHTTWFVRDNWPIWAITCPFCEQITNAHPWGLKMHAADCSCGARLYYPSVAVKVI